MMFYVHATNCHSEIAKLVITSFVSSVAAVLTVSDGVIRQQMSVYSASNVFDTCVSIS